jgi:hypothetical protein
MTNYMQKGLKLFPTAIYEETIPEALVDIAWEVMGILEEGLQLFEYINCSCCIRLNIDRFAGCEKVSSLVLRNLNRNNTPTGFKKSGFKPLRLFGGFEFYVVSDYLHHHHCDLRFCRELYGCYVRTLAKFLQLLSARGHAITSATTAIAGLTVALLEPSAHNSEPIVFAFMLHEYVYNDAHDPEDYQVYHTM